MRITVITAVAAVALLAGACGDDGATSTKATTTAAPASKAMWDGPEPTTKKMSTADATAMDDAVEATLNNTQGQTPAIWLGVWDSKKGKQVAAYGMAVLPDTAATVGDHNRIGSITKTFTATAMLQLVDGGKASLTDTVADILPKLAAAHPEIAGVTVQQLLGMTSGIPDYANSDWFLPARVKDPAKVLTAPEIIEQTLAKGIKAVGTKEYSTTNHLILGEMITKLTGQPIEKVLTSLATENGMPDTALPAPGDNALPDPSSHGYVNDFGVQSLAEVGAEVESGTDVTDWSASWGGAGGSMYSTVDDLGTWAGTGLGNRMLTEATVKERLTTTAVPEVGDYGLGIIDFGDGWIGHTGQIVGWEALALYNTRTGDVIVGMTNETGSLLGVSAAVATLYPELATVLI